MWKISKPKDQKKKKGKKQQYGLERYKTLSEDESIRLVDYRKNI